jgi:dihydroorotate dehydrogenase
LTPIEFIARSDNKFRPFLLKLPPYVVSFIYSNARKPFLNWLQNSKPDKIYLPPTEESRKLWGIHFPSSLFNAAGMFKNGHGYELAAMQGAGAFLAGTTTAIPRKGNSKNGIIHPFMPYPSSGAASNWMGLPNEGNSIVAKRLSRIERINNCPIGASIAGAPEQTGIDALEGIVEGMKLYELAGVDFIELNESCPNIPHDANCESSLAIQANAKISNNCIDDKLVERLESISQKFLKNRKRNLPVIVKFSNDTNIEQLPALLDILINLGFDGINIGNTSTQYLAFRDKIILNELNKFDYFTVTYGGGLSGRILKENSLKLSTYVVEYIERHQSPQEFHIIRTGGIESKDDLEESKLAGIQLNQWFTGYFENFARYGHDLYKILFM